MRGSCYIVQKDILKLLSKGLEKGCSIKGLDLEVELPHLKLCRIPPPLSLCNKDVQIVFWKKAKNKTVPI